MTDQPQHMSWDAYFHNLLAPIAAKSKDPNTKIGCVVVGPDREIRSTGYNSFPRGLDDNVPGRQERPEKYFWVEHAERNAIYNAARCGTQTKNCTIYVSEVPCLDCARGIVQSGISHVVVCKVEQNEAFNARWTEHLARVEQLFAECGVNLRFYTGEGSHLVPPQAAETAV